MSHYSFYHGETANMAGFGQYGLRVLTSNAVEGETFVAIQAIADSVISSTLVPLPGVAPPSVGLGGFPTGEVGDTTITSLALAKGMVICGRFVDLQVVSGKVIAYKG